MTAKLDLEIMSVYEVLYEKFLFFIILRLDLLQNWMSNDYRHILI
jgi:hypothetical protein